MTCFFLHHKLPPATELACQRFDFFIRGHALKMTMCADDDLCRDRDPKEPEVWAAFDQAF